VEGKKTTLWTARQKNSFPGLVVLTVKGGFGLDIMRINLLTGSIGDGGQSNIFY
jgi:hypothetical protein